MSSPSQNRTALQSPKPKVQCCNEPECTTGLRNNYYEGKRLTPDSFRTEQRYGVDRRWLLNRAVLGWGVVYGYALSVTSGSALEIGAGLALDPCGRELLQSAMGIVTLADLLVLDEKCQIVDLDTARKVYDAARQKTNDGTIAEKEEGGECWLLRAHYAEHPVGPVRVTDPCHCDYDEWDHTCELVRYSLQRVPCDKCRCELDCGLDCKCKDVLYREEPQDGARQGYPAQDMASQRQQSREKEDCDDCPEPAPPRARGNCRCLCEYVTNLPIQACGSLCETEDHCGHTVRIDLCRGVPLACVRLVKDECERWAFDPRLEVCDARRLVKRNDMLFDLLRGCDLTRICEIGWADWHRKKDAISFEKFANAFGDGTSGSPGSTSNRFWVRFSRAVRKGTLRPDCFTMTVLTAEQEGGWWQSFRVPIVRVDTTGCEESDNPELVHGATFVVSNRWLHDAVQLPTSRFQKWKTRVEIEVRGDFIVDCNGQSVDANAVGAQPFPTGNGTPGGTFVSTFLVDVQPSKPEPYEE